MNSFMTRYNPYEHSDVVATWHLMNNVLSCAFGMALGTIFTALAMVSKLPDPEAAPPACKPQTEIVVPAAPVPQR